MANNTNWLNISSQSGSSGQTILTLSANKNYSTNYKTAEITAYNPVYNVSAKTYVTLEAYSAYLSLDPTLFGVPDTGGTYELTINANCGWVIAFPDLVSSYSTTSGSGTTTVTFSVPSTSADTTLVGNIVVTDESGQISRIARIEQYGAGVHMGIFPVELYFDSTGGSKTFTVTADCAYQVSMNNTPWATVSPNSGYTGQTTFTVTVNDEYTGTTTRQGAVNIDAPGQDLAVILYQRPPETRLVATYYVTSTTDPTKILQRTASFSAAEYPDGTPITLGTGYTFPTTGYQTVYYTLTGDTVGDSTFSGTPITSAVIPKGVTSLGQGCIQQCSGLTSVTLPNTLTSIGNACFLSIMGNGLSAITLPDSLTSIGWQAFRGCTSLSSITIPSAVTYIGTNCFSASSVSSITFTSLTPPTLAGQNSLLNGNPLREIIVPCPAVDDYLTAWPYYAQYISCQDTGTTLYFVTDTSNVKGIGETRTITILNTNINPNRTGLNLPSDFPQQGSYTVVGNTIYLTYPRNPSSSATRSWTIGVVAQTNDGVSLSGSYSITQNANVTYSIPYTADTSTVNKTGETRTITIDTSNLVASSITIGVEGATGITYSYDNGVVTVVFPPNLTDTKNVIITIDGETITGNYATVSIPYTQNGEIEGRLVITYNVTSTTGYTKILDSNYYNPTGAAGFSKIELENGTEIGKYSKSYKFPSTGFQQVFYTLSDSTRLPKYAFSGLNTVFEAKIPEGVAIIDQTFIDCTNLSAVTLPNSLRQIGGYAFAGTQSLYNISFNEGITTFSSYAFRGSGVQSLTFPDSVTDLGQESFRECNNLTAITFGTGITNVPFYTFSGCSSLENVVFPNTIQTISNYSFSHCPIVSMDFGTGVTSIGVINANYSQTTGMTFHSHIPPVLTDTGYSLGSATLTFPLFVPCAAMSAYTDSASWTNYKHRIQCFEEPIIPITTGTPIEITYYVTDNTQPTIILNNIEGFDYAEGVGETLPDLRVDYRLLSGYTFPTTGAHTIRYYLSEPIIPENAWYNCSAVIDPLIIPSGITTIKSGCFYGTSITELTIPNGVITIENAVANCPNITIDSNAYMSSSGYGYGGKVFASFINVSELVIGNNVTFIGPYSFTDYPNARSPRLKKIELSNSVTGLGENAFYQYSNNNYGLSITLPDSIVEIGRECFYCSDSIYSVILPSGITYLPARCFRDCMHLQGIEIPDSVTGIGEQCFLMKDCDENQQPISADLRTVIIGSGVTEIGSEAFAYCHSLKNVVAKPLNAPSIYSNSFIGCYGVHWLYTNPGADYSTWLRTDRYYPGFYNWGQKDLAEIPFGFLDYTATYTHLVTGITWGSGGTNYLSSKRLFIAANSNWSITKSIGADWLQFIPAYTTGNTGFYPFSVLFDKNTTGQDRSATIILNDGTNTTTLSVTQTG